MAEEDTTGDRFSRFHTLYGEVVKSEFDPLEFAEDDFYAFQVLDRAFRSENQELRNLAAHLQMQREAALETITLRATEILESTKRLKTLELKVLEQRGESGDLGMPVPETGEVEASSADQAPAADDTASEDETADGELEPAPRAAGDAARPARGKGGPARRRKGWFR